MRINVLMFLLFASGYILKGQNVDTMDLINVDSYLSSRGNAEEKVQYLNTYLEDNPKDDYLLGMKGYFLLEVDQQQAERFLLEKFINNPEYKLSSYSSLAIGSYFSGQEDYEKANKYFNLSRKQDPEGKNKWLYLELFHFAESEVEAQKYLEKALEIDSSFYYALLGKAFYLMDSKMNCKNIIQILGGLDLAFESAEVINHLADSYFHCSQFQEALNTYGISLNREDNLHAHLMLGNILSIQGDLALAEKHYLSSLEFSNSQLAIKPLGWIYYRKGNYVEAEKLLNSLVEIDSNQENYNELILFHLKTRHYSKARKTLEESIDVNGSSKHTDGYRMILDLIDANPNEMDKINAFLNKKDSDIINWLNEFLDRYK